MAAPHPTSLPCRNHPEIETEACCEACRLPVCPDCRVRIAGRALCGACKTRAVREACRRTGPRDRDADEALAFALMALVPFLSLILSPVALWKGIAALGARRRDPSLPGGWKSKTAIGLSSAVLLVWLVGALVWWGSW